MLRAAGVGGVEGVGGRQEVAGGEAGALRGEGREGGGGDAAGVEDDDVGGGAGAGERVQERDGAGQVVGVGDEGDVGARVAGGAVEGRRVGHGAQSGQRTESGKAMASKGGTRTSSSSFRAAIRVQAPSRRAKASRVRAMGSTNQRCATPALRVDAALVGEVDAAGARAQDLADPVGREVEPGRLRVGAASARGASPPRSGTSTSVPRCSSGSSMIHQPPGPPRRCRTGPPSSTPSADAGAGMARGRARMQVQRALDQLGDHVLRGVEDVLVGGRAADRGRVLVHGASLARRRRLVRRSSGRGARGRARRAGRSPWSRRRRRGCGSGRRGRRISSPPRRPRRAGRRAG